MNARGPLAADGEATRFVVELLGTLGDLLEVYGA